MPVTSEAERVRAWVEDKIIQPAKARGHRTFTVTAGDVHRELGLKNRVPLVCQALKSKRLLERNNLVLKDVSGPPSGLSTTLKVTYEIVSTGADESKPKPNPLWGLRGIAKDVFRRLGGGENFIRQERKELSAAMEERQPFKADAEASFKSVWQSIIAHAGEGFFTIRRQPFQYKLSGESVWIERDGHPINQALAQSEFRKAWKRWPVQGPGELQDLRGPSYIFAILSDPRVREGAES